MCRFELRIESSQRGKRQNEANLGVVETTRDIEEGVHSRAGETLEDSSQRPADLQDPGNTTLVLFSAPEVVPSKKRPAVDDAQVGDAMISKKEKSRGSGPQGEASSFRHGLITVSPSVLKGRMNLL